ncbi:type II toxin-antitoxin system Phd/YefM family antitoxin [Actinomyces oris]|uniref:type II toxin-antitoxin system Phd/YefM family antitoxin n=1 Tax=Actinomyces oris TaxID=544580 RepID=UPI00211644CC|nr:type II toxin-antitoxin system prevent-host-death family antitoxin [Actinomyces oris]
MLALIDRIAASHHAVEIVSSNGRAVLMPADEYAAWQETAYLFRHLRTPGVSSMHTNGLSRALALEPDLIAAALEGAGVQIGDKGAPMSPARETKRWNHAVSSRRFRPVLGLCHRFGHCRASRWRGRRAAGALQQRRARLGSICARSPRRM